jgi:hypothetical protein
MSKDVKSYIKTCKQCQWNKPINQPTTGLLQPLDIPSQRWECITMDFVVQLPKTKRGFDTIVIFVEKLTK